jgi:hypothetical protein
MQRPLAVLLTLLAAAAWAEPPAWRDRGKVDGIQLETREVEGSAFEELRLTTQSKQPLPRLCEAVFGKGAAAKGEGNFKKREVLKETETDRWTYEVIALPVVSDRDYVVHVQVLQPAESGQCEVSFQTEDDPSRPVRSEYVRLKAVRGHWLLTPVEGGAVKIVYRIFSDPGGAVPPFLVWGGARSAAVDSLKTILRRVEAAESPDAGSPSR